jgi:uncharacterized protein
MVPPDPKSAPPPALRAVRTAAKCPVCGRPAEETRYQPFCTKRCADIDLGRWLKEGYRVATDEAPDEGEGSSAGEGPGGQSGQRR